MMGIGATRGLRLGRNFWRDRFNRWFRKRGRKRYGRQVARRHVPGEFDLHGSEIVRAHDLAPVQIELTWYVPPRDLPPISLPAALSKPAVKPVAPKVSAEPEPTRGADAHHPRQTILSVPVRATHPRQTLLEPDAPPLPPKIVPQLPNIVEWAASQPKAR